MNNIKDISSYIASQMESVEAQLDLADLTIQHGLQSFRFGTSTYLEDLFSTLQLKEGSIFYDLGSGYGNIILYGAFFFPSVNFVGIEIVKERNDVCNALIEKLLLHNVKTHCKDFFTVDFTDGDVFYLYNPLHEFHYESMLEKLKKIAETKQITVIAESKCDVFDAASWLQNYKTIDTDIDIRKKMKFYRSSL